MGGASDHGGVDKGTEVGGASVRGDVDEGTEVGGTLVHGGVDEGTEVGGASVCGGIDEGTEVGGASVREGVDEETEVGGASDCGGVDEGAGVSAVELESGAMAGSHCNSVHSFLRPIILAAFVVRGVVSSPWSPSSSHCVSHASVLASVLNPVGGVRMLSCCCVGVSYCSVLTTSSQAASNRDKFSSKGETAR